MDAIETIRNLRLIARYGCIVTMTVGVYRRMPDTVPPYSDEVSSSSRRSAELRTAATFWTRRAADDEQWQTSHCLRISVPTSHVMSVPPSDLSLAKADGTEIPCAGELGACCSHLCRC